MNEEFYRLSLTETMRSKEGEKKENLFNYQFYFVNNQAHVLFVFVCVCVFACNLDHL